MLKVARVNVIVYRRQTALHKAAIAKRRRACEELVRAGACATCEDINGDTPSGLALGAGDKKLAHFLQSKLLKGPTCNNSVGMILILCFRRRIDATDQAQ